MDYLSPTIDPWQPRCLIRQLSHFYSVTLKMRRTATNVSWSASTRRDKYPSLNRNYSNSLLPPLPSLSHSFPSRYSLIPIRLHFYNYQTCSLVPQTMPDSCVSLSSQPSLLLSVPLWRQQLLQVLVSSIPLGILPAMSTLMNRLYHTVRSTRLI